MFLLFLTAVYVPYIPKPFLLSLSREYKEYDYCNSGLYTPEDSLTFTCVVKQVFLRGKMSWFDEDGILLKENEIKSDNVHSDHVELQLQVNASDIEREFLCVAEDYSLGLNGTKTCNVTVGFGRYLIIISKKIELKEIDFLYNPINIVYI